MHHKRVNLHHEDLDGLRLPMQPSALGSGLTSQSLVVWLGPGSAEALRGVLLAVAELLVSPVAAATALRDSSCLL